MLLLTPHKLNKILLVRHLRYMKIAVMYRSRTSVVEVGSDTQHMNIDVSGLQRVRQSPEELNTALNCNVGPATSVAS
jgi:hypothetical protein